MLPVPELIPFRLSRVLIEALAPYRTGGLYRHTTAVVLARTD
jgi:phosphatidylinositol kinase/protein kinase (PI-3  family)